MKKDGSGGISCQRDIVHLFIRTAKLHHTVVEGKVAGLGVHHSQHRMLMHLAKYDKIPSQKELADAFGVSPAAVATTLKRLEHEGYIEKSTTDEDNRCNEISITAKGRQMVEKSHDIFEHIDGEMFRGLDDRQIEEFEKTLEIIRANLEREGDT